MGAHKFFCHIDQGTGRGRLGGGNDYLVRLGVGA